MKRRRICEGFEIPAWEKIDEEFDHKLSCCQPPNENLFSTTIDGVLVQEGVTEIPTIKDVLVSEEVPDLSLLRFRDPDHFVAGGVHKDPSAWQKILVNHPKGDQILNWISSKVDVHDFVNHYSGTFKGESYDSDFPPPKYFRNHALCKKFSTFISDAILKRVAMGSVRVWGKVDLDEPPYLVLPLTVEPSKPRLCLDARFLNLWMKDCPFSLDKLVDVKRYIYKDSYFTKCDDKSGYDHVHLQESSQVLFGFEWGGWWFVSTTLPFGWKESPYIYHTMGLAASSYLRSCGVPCSLYIDDRLNGEVFAPTGPWSLSPSARTEKFRLEAAKVAIFIVASLLIQLGYTIGIQKSVLYPAKRIEYLGHVVDSSKQAFELPGSKVVAFATLREEILACKKTVNVRTLQRFQGKCVSFSLAVPGAKLFIRNISSAIASSPGNGQVKMTDSLREEICHWRFLDSWKGHIPWREERHVRLSLSTDASGYGWGCVMHSTSGDQSFRDYWNPQQIGLNISTKEMLAISNAIKATPEHVRDCRVDVQVDSQVAIDTYNGQGSKNSPQLTAATKELYFTVVNRNLQLELSHIASDRNEADGPSRCLSALDSTLSPRVWELIEHTFGGLCGHTFDLMALDSNAQLSKGGTPLPHFTPCPSPQSKGVNFFAQDINHIGPAMANPYIFPPFGLVPAVLRFLTQFRIPFTIVVPELYPRPFWWPILTGLSRKAICLGSEGDWDVLRYPSRSGYKPRVCPFKLWAFRVSKF